MDLDVWSRNCSCKGCLWNGRKLEKQEPDLGGWRNTLASTRGASVWTRCAGHTVHLPWPLPSHPSGIPASCCEVDLADLRSLGPSWDTVLLCTGRSSLGPGGQGCGRLDQNPISQSKVCLRIRTSVRAMERPHQFSRSGAREWVWEMGRSQDWTVDWVAKQSYRVSPGLCPERSWPPRGHSWVSECVKVAQSCLTLCDPTDYTDHGILQARILEWVAFPFSRASSQPRGWTQVSHIAGRFFTSWATG